LAQTRALHGKTKAKRSETCRKYVGKDTYCSLTCLQSKAVRRRVRWIHRRMSDSSGRGTTTASYKIGQRASLYSVHVLYPYVTSVSPPTVLIAARSVDGPRARASHSRTPFAVSCLQQILTRPPADKTIKSFLGKQLLASSHFFQNLSSLITVSLERRCLALSTCAWIHFPKHSSRTCRKRIVAKSSFLNRDSADEALARFSLLGHLHPSRQGILLLPLRWT